MNVQILPLTAAFLSTLGLGDFTESEPAARMAQVARFLRDLDDAPDRFPHGKWATIQSIEQQVDAALAERS